MCPAHREKFLKYGDPTFDGQKARVIPWQERFWDKVYPCPVTGCWHWGAYISHSNGGYGKFTFGVGDNRPAHRVAYETVVGPIPEGLTLDHLCRVPSCVNPDHLEPVTLAENTRRNMSPTVVSRRTGRCVSGLHEMTPENTYVRPDGSGYRWCRACAAIREGHRASAKNQGKSA